VRVLIVEDVDELRATLRQALRLDGRFEVVGDIGDGPGAVALAAELQPDVVVLDLGLPGLAGRELVTGVRTAAPEARVVVYTGSVTAENANLDGTVDAFVMKQQGVKYLVGLLGRLDESEVHTASIELGPDIQDVRRARAFLYEHCSEWGCQDVVADAQLVLSELVTNALVHAGTRCELRARFHNSLLRIEVRDSGSGTPDLQAPTGRTEGGRGLRIVSALCQAWGVDTEHEHGKVVWAELVVGVDARRSAAPNDSIADASARRTLPRSATDTGAAQGLRRAG
jgi:CheY-like chemotaxis protein/anti-sigma regulatory factor (Ser/Thr protein kinase)